MSEYNFNSSYIFSYPTKHYILITLQQQSKRRQTVNLVGKLSLDEYMYEIVS